MLPRRATPRELAVLRHPDVASPWTVGLTVGSSAVASIRPADVVRLVEAAPMLAACWTRNRWRRGNPPSLTHGPLLPLLRAFDLRSEPPLRLAIDLDNELLHLAGHHAALDGLGLVAVARSVLGLPFRPPPPSGVISRRPGAASPSLWRRALWPADRVLPSDGRPPDHTLASRAANLAGGQVTARIAAAAALAIARHNAAANAPTRRIGISIGVGGDAGIGNTATYRRADCRGDGDREAVISAVQSALAVVQPPGELRRPSRALRLLSPVIRRFSDTFLVSNLGRLDLPGVSKVEFYPVARGRSAVAFGAAGLAGGPSTLTIRARDLNQADAEQLLDDVVRGLGD